MATRAQKRVNLVVSRIIPPVLLGVVVYASYAITKPICSECFSRYGLCYFKTDVQISKVDYLLHPLPSYNRSPRVGAGAVILAIYYLLLISMVATYIRLLYGVFYNPGYLPLGAERLKADSSRPASTHSRRRRSRHRNSRKGREIEKPDQTVDLEQGGNTHTGGGAFELDPAGLESFYTKDVFVCQDDGRPPYCSTCCQFKTDRAHHCREVDRCVRKMDHFCPWYVDR